MIKDTIKATVAAFLAAYWWVVVLAGLILIGLFFVFGQIESCNSKKYKKKNEQIKSNISEDKGAANVIKEERNEIKQEINAANTETRIAVNNRITVTNTDSGTRNKSREAAIRAFCEQPEHANDSNCVNRR
jgi:type III secretory pathway component EscU